MRHRRTLSIITALVISHGVARSQQAQIEQARQFGSTSTAVVQSPEAVTATSLESRETRDNESFGIQQILREEERLRPFRAYTEISAFVTNNVALTRRDPTSDSFLLASFGLEYRRPLQHGFQLETTLRVATFRYGTFDQLDFTSVDAGIGIAYHSQKLGGVDLFARYNFNDLIGVESEETFFKNHTLTVGIQKAVPFSQAHYAFFGAAAQVGFADPKIAERSEFSLFAGYHLQATRNLQVDFVYRCAVYLYSEGGRRDLNQSLSLGASYRITDWFSASISSSAGLNRSNQEVFDYDAFSGGVGLTLSMQF